MTRSHMQMNYRQFHSRLQKHSTGYLDRIRMSRQTLYHEVAGEDVCTVGGDGFVQTTVSCDEDTADQHVQLVATSHHMALVFLARTDRVVQRFFSFHVRWGLSVTRR